MFQNVNMPMIKTSSSTNVPSVTIQRQGTQSYAIAGSPVAQDGSPLPPGNPFSITTPVRVGMFMRATLSFDPNAYSAWHSTFHAGKVILIPMTVQNVQQPENLQVTLSCSEVTGFASAGNSSLQSSEAAV